MFNANEQITAAIKAAGYEKVLIRANGWVRARKAGNDWETIGHMCELSGLVSFAAFGPLPDAN